MTKQNNVQSTVDVFKEKKMLVFISNSLVVFYYNNLVKNSKNSHLVLGTF